MELDALIVADAVTTPPDGKFNILGGGIGRCTVPELPFPLPLGILARLKVADRDLNKTHTFLLQLIGPAGIPNVAPLEIRAHAPPDAGPRVEGEERFFHIGLEIPAVAAKAGLYYVEFHINGKLARRIPLPVVVGSDTQPVKAPARTKRAAKPKTKRPPPPPKKRRR